MAIYVPLFWAGSLALHGPVNNMNLCKLILEQAKAMKPTWSTACGSGVGRLMFQGTKKPLDEYKDLNALVSNGVKEILKNINA